MQLNLWTILGLLLVWLVLLWSGLWWWSRRQALKRRPVALSLWQRLCQVHALTDAETQRLEALAREHQLTEPLLLWIDPRWLERSLEKSPPDAASLEQLGQKLYGSAFMDTGRDVETVR